MQSSNENPTFEQIGKPQWDPSGVFRIRYGSDLNDPMPFVLTVTLPYVARELGKSVSFAEISKGGFKCPPSALVGQIRQIEEGSVSGSS
jgi:hypothetical protein